MKFLIAASILFCTAAQAQYQRERFDAPSGTQGRPIQVELETSGRIVGVRTEQMEVTVGYTCPNSGVNPNQRGSAANIGTLAGAVIGGAVANHAGSGRGKTAMTVAGAVAGGYVGNEINQRLTNDDRQQAQTGECFEVKDYVPVYVYRVLINGINFRGTDKQVLIEQTNVRSFKKYAIGQEIPAKIQINYFVGRLD